MTLQFAPEVRADLTHWATSDIPRVPIGYSFFDRRTSGGIATGELALFMARTTVGKTWFAINVLNNNPDVPAVMFSLEMHSRYILNRLAAMHMDVTTSTIEDTLRVRGRANAVDRTVEDFPHLALYDTPGPTVGDMLETLDDYEKAQGYRPVLAVIDYLELVRAFGMTQMENVDRLAWRMKDFAREGDVAVICLHQVKRGEKVKIPGVWPTQWTTNEGQLPLSLTDGRFGGEMAADYVLGMYRPALAPEMDYEERQRRANDVRLQYLKTRTDGGLVQWGEQHIWDPRNGRIREYRTGAL